MRAIICTDREWQALEKLAYDGLVKDKVIDETLRDEETGKLDKQVYSTPIRHHDGRLAFRVEERVEKYLPDLEKVIELSWDWFCPAHQIRRHKVPIYWCAYSYDHSKLYFTGVVDVGQELTTGQPHLLVADTEAELEKKVDSVFGEGYHQRRKPKEDF